MFNFHTHQSVKNAIINIDSPEINIHPDLYYSIGNHPWFNHFSTDQLETFIHSNDNILSVGECGLDKVRFKLPLSQQIEMFKKQIKLSEKYKLPVTLHIVRAFDEIIALKKELKPNQNWIIHGFNKYKMTEKLISEGFYLSFGADLLRNEKLQIEFNKVPLNRLFFETDDADIEIEKIYTFASKLIGCKIDELIQTINENLNKITNGRLA